MTTTAKHLQGKTQGELLKEMERIFEDIKARSKKTLEDGKKAWEKLFLNPHDNLRMEVLGVVFYPFTDKFIPDPYKKTSVMDNNVKTYIGYKDGAWILCQQYSLLVDQKYKLKKNEYVKTTYEEPHYASVRRLKLIEKVLYVFKKGEIEKYMTDRMIEGIVKVFNRNIDIEYTWLHLHLLGFIQAGDRKGAEDLLNKCSKKDVG